MKTKLKKEKLSLVVKVTIEYSPHRKGARESLVADLLNGNLANRIGCSSDFGSYSVARERIIEI